MELKSTDGKATGALLVEVENLSHLTRIIKSVRKVKGITEVARRERITGDG
jgi:GTP pyrophosphokinase